MPFTGGKLFELRIVGIDDVADLRGAFSKETFGERGENSPFQVLYKLTFATAFREHPYHHPTIGWRSDVEGVPTSRLKAFYDTFYWPDNATVSVIGDFEPAATLALVKKYYGVIPRAPHPIPQVYTEEPAQTGPRPALTAPRG